MKIADLLSLYMRVNRISVRDLADEIGLSPATISRITIGKEILGSSMVKLIIWLTK